jgi:hypothetical protein
MATEDCLDCGSEKTTQGLMRSAFVQDADGKTYILINDNCDLEVAACVDCETQLPLEGLMRSAMVCDPVTGLTYFRTYNPEPCGGGDNGGGETILYRNTATESWNVAKGASQNIHSANYNIDWANNDLYIEAGILLGNMAASKYYDIYFNWDNWNNYGLISVNTNASFGSSGSYALSVNACFRKVLLASDSNEAHLMFNPVISQPPINCNVPMSALDCSKPLPPVGNLVIHCDHGGGTTQALSLVLWHLKLYTKPIV